MDGYLDALNPVQGSYITLCNKPVWVDRARFGLHLRLSELDQKFESSTAADEMAAIIRAYLAMCGIEDTEASNIELLLAFSHLRQLNNWQWILPFMSGSAGAGQDKPPYDYEGRYWAWWVHELASRYGWSRDEIFNLWPEEAAVYLQEILISKIEEAEQARSLSEVSYRYDKQTKKSKFIPMPKPGWMVGDVANGNEPKKVKILKGFLPVGNVIDIGGMGLLSGNRKANEDTMVQ